MTDLTGTQISSLLETLPGIAQVLRSPVADAFVGLIRAASGQGTFNLADADEVMKYAVRRNLMSADESEQVMLEAREAVGRKPAAGASATPRRPAPKRAGRKAASASRPATRSKPKPKAKPKAAAKRPPRKAGKSKARTHKKK